MIQLAALVVVIGLKLAGVVGWGWGAIFGWYLVSVVVGEALAQVVYAIVGRPR